MICNNCKTQMEDDMSYCSKCGEPVTKEKKVKYPPLFNYLFALLMILLLIIIFFFNYKEISDMPNINIIIMFVYFLGFISLIGLIAAIRIRIISRKQEVLDKLINSSKQKVIRNKSYIIIKDKSIKIVEVITKVVAISFLSFFMYITIKDYGGFNKVMNNFINEFKQILSGGSVVGNWYFECQSVGNASCVAIYNYLTFNEDNTLTCTEVYNQGTGSCGTGTWSQDNSTITIYWNKSPITPAYTATATLNGDTLISGNQVLSRTK